MTENSRVCLTAGKSLRIAISGKSGCGNTTASRLLADTLGIRMINYTFRTLAEETGLTLAEIIEKAKTDDSWDIRVDTRQVELALQESCVLGSRLAIWMLEQADLKVYLYAADEIRAERIQKREGGSPDEIRRFTAMRDEQDTSRYRRLYSIDNNDYSFADLVIDSGINTPEKIVSRIIAELVSRNLVCAAEH